MDVRGDSALIAGKAADFDVLADGEDLLLQQGVHSLLGAGSLAGQQGFHVGGVLLDNGVSAGLDKGLEVGVLGDKVGLGVDLDDHAHLAVLADSGESHALGGDAASLLHGSGQALLAQEVNGLFHIALGSGEGLLAIYHAAAGLLTKGGDVFRGKIHVATSFLVCPLAGQRAKSNQRSYLFYRKGITLPR